MVEPEEILEEALRLHKPVSVKVLFSGGGDSALTAYKTLAYLDSRGVAAQVVSVDTLISGDGWRDFISGYAKEAGWNFEVRENPNPGFYETWVSRFGFPYTPRGHLTMQNRLKLRAIERLVQDNKDGWYSRVMLVTGFRKYESQRRMATSDPIQRQGAKVWVNPLFYYMDDRKEAELATVPLPDNPFKRLWGISGDCGCGAFAQPGELERVRRYFPVLGKRICDLQDKVKKNLGPDAWGWDERPCSATVKLITERRKLSEAHAPLLDAVESSSPMCAGCRRIKPEQGRAVDDVLMQRMEW